MRFKTRVPLSSGFGAFAVPLYCLIRALVGPTATSVAATGEELSALQTAAKNCVAHDLRDDNPTCKKIKAFVSRTRPHKTDAALYTENEWRVRQAIQAKGIDLLKFSSPLHFFWKKTPGGEVGVVLDWGMNPDRSDPARWSKFRLMWESGVETETFDCGKYCRAFVFVKPVNGQWDLNLVLNVAGEYRPLTPSGNSYDSLEFHFKDSKSLDCRQAAPKETALCFTNYWGSDWPEIHILDDQRASTGIVHVTLKRVDGKYKAILSERGHYMLVKHKGSMIRAFVNPGSGEWFNDKWSFAYRGSVSVWSDSENKLQEVTALTEKFFPILGERKIRPGTDDPAEPGLYTAKPGNGLYRFTK